MCINVFGFVHLQCTCESYFLFFHSFFVVMYFQPGPHESRFYALCGF